MSENRPEEFGYKCPLCGSDGCSGTHYDPLTEKSVTYFYCDKDETHNFIITKFEMKS